MKESNEIPSEANDGKSELVMVHEAEAEISLQTDNNGLSLPNHEIHSDENFSSQGSQEDNVSPDELAKDSDDTADVSQYEDFMGPPDLLRSNHESRPGAFRQGGNLGNEVIAERASSNDVSHCTVEGVIITPADVLVNAELVNESVAEYVQAEPVRVPPVLDQEMNRSGNEKGMGGMRWRIVLLIVVLVIGLMAMILGIAMYLQGKGAVVESLALPVDDQIPISTDHDIAPQELQYDDPAVSLHAVIWGYHADCDDFDLPPLQISCGGEVEVLLNDRDRSCYSVQYGSAKCDLKNQSAIVLFRCLRGNGDIPLEATVTLPVAQASKCIGQGKGRDRSRKATSLRESSATSTAETFLAIGRFCKDSGTVMFHNNYNCQSGETVYAYAQDRRLHVRRSLRPKLCYSSNSCSSKMNCENATSDSCLTECNFALDSLKITDNEPDCFMDEGGGDVAIGEAQLEMFRNIVFEQMFLQLTSH